MSETKHTPRAQIRWDVGTKVRVLANDDTEYDWHPVPGDEGVVIGHEGSTECVNVCFKQGKFWLWNDDIEAIAEAGGKP